MKMQTVVGGGAILALLGLGSGGDVGKLIEATQNLTWPQAALFGALAVVAALLYVAESPATKAKIKDLTQRASLPPGKP